MRASRPLDLALATVIVLAVGQCTVRNPDYRVDGDNLGYRVDGGNPDCRVDGGNPDCRVDRGSCTRRCQGRPCGPDSCGGSCGVCSAGSTCETQSGSCIPTSKPSELASSCGAVTDKGCCAGTTLKHCQNGVLGTEDCSKDPLCGWNASKKWYECGTSGHADGKSAKACP